MEQMYDIVENVETYHEFVPWCKESQVMQRHDGGFKCRLTVGFPPVVERYMSVVTLSRPYMVKVVNSSFSSRQNSGNSDFSYFSWGTSEL